MKKSRCNLFPVFFGTPTAKAVGYDSLTPFTPCPLFPLSNPNWRGGQGVRLKNRRIYPSAMRKMRQVKSRSLN